MYTYKKFVALLALILAIPLFSGCSSDPETKIDEYIADHEYQEATTWLTEELRENPSDPLLNGLFGELLIKQCISENCFKNNPQMLASAAKHLRYVKGIVKTEDNERDIYGNIYEISKNLSRDIKQTDNFIMLIEALPETMPKGRFISLMTEVAGRYAYKFDAVNSAKVYASVYKLASKTDARKIFAKLFMVTLNNKEPDAETKKQISELAENQAISRQIMQAMPYVSFIKHIAIDGKNGTVNFTKSFPEEIVNLASRPLLSDKGQTSLAKIIYQMAEDKNFTTKAAKHMQPPARRIDGRMAVSQADELRMRLFKTAMLFTPSSNIAWEKFLNPAMDYVNKTGDISVLFDGLSPSDIPNNVVNLYNKQLFLLIKFNIANNKNIVPIIEKIIIPANNSKAVTDEALNLLKEAVTTAIENKNSELIYIYANYNPDIAQLYRQKIVALTIENLEEKWQNDNFSDMVNMASFLTEKMKIDFSIDNLLLQNFNEYLVQQKIVEKISADSYDLLLKDQSEVALKLGKKLEFIQQHFKNKPAVINNFFKELIVKAKGKYGTPTALYRLFNMFADADFPQKERQTYLANAIKNSIVKDKNLTALDVMNVGNKLHQKNPDIQLLFVANEALKRLKGLNNSITLWKNTNDDMREVMRNAKPQFVALMDAVDAYGKGDRQKSAKALTVLSNPEYIKMATPYLTEYVDTIRQAEGVYVLEDKNADINSAIIIIDLPYDNIENIKPDTDLTGIEVSLINLVGRVRVTSAQDLVEDYGKVFRYKIKTSINPNSMEIEITEKSKAATGLPQSFEQIFGNINKIKLSDNQLKAFIGDKSYNFIKASNLPQKTIFSSGRYGILKQISNVDAKTAHILPIGSIVSIQADLERPIYPTKGEKKLTAIYPVSGNLRHPSALQAREIKGFYSLEHHTLVLNYDYPLQDGSLLGARLRCHALGATITCAGHNKNTGRVRYSHIVQGAKVKADRDKKLNNNNFQRTSPSNQSQQPELLPPPAL